jgi:hypothetical protein
MALNVRRFSFFVRRKVEGLKPGFDIGSPLEAVEFAEGRVVVPGSGF